METVVPQYYNASGTPTISRENASYQSFGSSLPSIQPYGSMPIAVGAPAIYYHQPNTMANYVISHHNPVQLPHIQTNAIIKSRLYVPESMIGSLIGSKVEDVLV
jgi:hypothetical protein